jgi:colanic acid biosynthesis glycosyl transferase WcaI
VKILVYGLNYIPELSGIGKYTGELCEWLAERGHEVRVVSAVPYYPEWLVPGPYRGRWYRTEERNGVKVYRSQLYVPRRPRTLSRLLHLLSFAMLSAPQLFRHRNWRPDVVVGVEPTLFCAPAALVASRLFGAASVLHIQDFELDAMLGLGMGKLARLGTGVERWLMRRFDAVSTISYSMVEHAAAKLGNDREVLFFPNGVDIDFVKPGCSGDRFRELWGIPGRSKVVLYAGNMGKKQGLEIVLDTARVLKGSGDVVFVLVGAGAAAEDLRHAASAVALGNVRFFPLQPYEKLPELMALADVHLVVQRRGVADAVLPSKLTTILAAGGNALITAEADTELGRLCERHPGLTRRVDPEDAGLFADALRAMLAEVDVENRRPNRVARAYAEEHLDKERVLQRFEADLVRLVGRG